MQHSDMQSTPVPAITERSRKREKKDGKRKKKERGEIGNEREKKRGDIGSEKEKKKKRENK